MRAAFAEVLARSAERGALGAFTCYNLETAAGVVAAAEEAEAPLCILLSEKSFRGRAGDPLAAALVSVAERAAVPACVQLDHSSGLALMEHAFELGVGAVMADGSKLPYDGNVALVREAVALARRHGGGVEAELGRIEGDEDRSDGRGAGGAVAGAMTDPAQAADFLDRTGADCLAVSIGNLHGAYEQPPKLDWERLGQVREAVRVPLALHGASGLSEADLATAIRLGIRKVNVNTELRQRYFGVLAEWAGELSAGWNLLELGDALAKGAAEVAAEKLRSYRPRLELPEG